MLPRQADVDPNSARVVLTPSKDKPGTATASLQYPGLPDGTMPDGPPVANSGGASPASAPGASTGGMFDFSAAFGNTAVNRRAHWRESGTEAIEEARRKGLPLLILFSHQSSPPAQQLDIALSNTPELNSDQPRFVPLRLDFYDRQTRESAYYSALRDRYKIRGYPVLLLALPDGTELTRHSGCTKEWRANVNHWLDDAAARAHSGIEAHRHRLEAQKYRLWKNKDGNEVFARLESQDANQLVFTTEWGETIRTFTNRLSAPDQERIAAKKF